MSFRKILTSLTPTASIFKIASFSTLLMSSYGQAQNVTNSTSTNSTDDGSLSSAASIGIIIGEIGFLLCVGYICLRRTTGEAICPALSSSLKIHVEPLDEPVANKLETKSDKNIDERRVLEIDPNSLGPLSPTTTSPLSNRWSLHKTAEKSEDHVNAPPPSPSTSPQNDRKLALNLNTQAS